MEKEGLSINAGLYKTSRKKELKTPAWQYIHLIILPVFSVCSKPHLTPPAEGPIINIMNQ